MVKGRRNRQNANVIRGEEVASPKKKDTKIESPIFNSSEKKADKNINTDSDGRNNNCTNIFLQEPVLTLDFDKTPNESSRITIKNSFLTTDVHYKFSPNAMLKDSKETMNIDINNVQNNAKNSLQTSDDSFVNTSRCNGSISMSAMSSPSPSPSSINKSYKKPLTPHRILCNSSIKAEITVKPVASHSYLNTDKKRTRNYNTRKRLHNKDPENINNQSFCKGDENEHIDAIKPVLNSSANPTAKQNSKNNKTLTETKLTDFFPVRRSVRKTKKEVIEEQNRDIQKAIIDGREEGLAVKEFEEKGRGVVTTRPFVKGEFVVEYVGDLITVTEAKERETMYAQDDNTGCYMYYFKHQNIQHCIDATAESGKLGRLVNHSRNGNLITKTVFYNNRPHLVLIAKENIDSGVEVTYDYGDRSKESLQYHPWLAF